MAKILDGLRISKEIKLEIADEIQRIVVNGLRVPHLVAILVGDDDASNAYVNNKVKDCREVGFSSSVIRMSKEISETELLKKILELNKSKDVDGFIVQLPLPEHIDQEKIIMAIDPCKDVDGFHPQNFGKMALEIDTLLPATPFGILTLFERYNIDTNGKNCVVIGRSRIVGRPISILMGRKNHIGNSTVTLIHSYTKNIEYFTKNADIIITALGRPYFLKGKMIKEGSVIVDVGITRINDNSKRGYKFAGDVCFDSCEKKASWITPVPGGVGPMTRAMLMKNTLIAYKNIFK